ncbi:MAG TPA: DUF2934 domain-containing protein [Nitrospira sp.]|nr:DUF2934 domain-containing protein [Nitrospira sp.]
MRTQTTKDRRREKILESVIMRESTVPGKEPVHSQPVSSGEDASARIARRAYEIYLERGSRSGDALSDWLEAEREILNLECQA